jgi:4-hydroxybenzoate polyprenyltransferase
MTTVGTRREPGQLSSLLRAAHPRQAVALAAGVALLVVLMGRPMREVAISALAVLVTQMIAGLLNDVIDAGRDRAAETERKPIADGHLPAGNATFAITVLTLIAIPLSLQSGLEAGLFLLATPVVAFVHSRWLQRTVLSFVGWCTTFALLAYFVTWGGWANETEGSAPLTSFVVWSAALGLCVHFLTALPDLVVDNRSGKRHLPLRIALRTGAPVLLVVSGVVTIAVTGLLVHSALTAGIAS